jgi:tight adherence protein B
MAILFAVLIFLIVALAIFLGGAWIEGRNAQARILRERLGGSQEQSATDNLELLRDEMLSKIPAFDTILRRSERASLLQKLLDQAGINTRVGNFFLLCLAAGVAGAIIFFILGHQNLPLAWAGMMIGLIAPYSYASIMRTRRFAKFEEVFPQAIDTLGRAVRAGHAFTTALEMITNEIPEPVASEFRKLFEEQKFGMPVRDALMNLADRIPLVDVKFFVTAVMLQRETGGNLAEILDNLSYMIRERFKILRQVKVYTAQGRLTMLLLMMLPPLIVVVMLIMNPDFIRPLFTDPIGHALVAAGITLQTVGYFVIRKIIQIQV